MDNFVRIRRSYQSRIRWEDIAQQIAAGNDGYLSVGDSVSCTLKDGTEVVLDVLALNPYEPDSVAFGIHDIYWKKPWNERDSNAGGWHDSKIRQDCNNGDIYNLFPDDLVSMITPRKIVQNIRGRTFESLDKFWLLSYTEVFGTDRGTDQTGDVNDIQFEFFKDKRNRIKFMDGEVCRYSLRSPGVGGTTHFWRVSNGGNVGSYYAGGSFGVCPCFIISKQS